MIIGREMHPPSSTTPGHARAGRTSWAAPAVTMPSEAYESTGSTAAARDGLATSAGLALVRMLAIGFERIAALAGERWTKEIGSLLRPPYAAVSFTASRAATRAKERGIGRSGV